MTTVYHSMSLDFNALEILAKVVSCYEETFIANRRKGTPHLSNTLLLSNYKDKKDDDKRISCHRCGNIRKKRFYCSRAPCPHVFCGRYDICLLSFNCVINIHYNLIQLNRCADKMKEDYGPDVFVSGCPVCLDLCCCSNKSAACDRKNHCYRKCPASKSKPNDGTEIQRPSEYNEFKGILNFNSPQHDHLHEHADHDEGATQPTHEYCPQGCGHNHDHNYDHEHSHEHAAKRSKQTHSTNNDLACSSAPAALPNPLLQPANPNNPTTSAAQTPSLQSASALTPPSPFASYPYNMMHFPNVLPYTSTQPNPFLTLSSQPTGSTSSGSGVMNGNTTSGPVDPAMMAIMYSMPAPWLDPADMSSLLSTQMTSPFPYLQPVTTTSTSSSSTSPQRESLLAPGSNINPASVPLRPVNTASMPQLSAAFPPQYSTPMSSTSQNSTSPFPASYPYSLVNNPLMTYPMYKMPFTQPTSSSSQPSATGANGGMYMNMLLYPYSSNATTTATATLPTPTTSTPSPLTDTPHSQLKDTLQQE